MVLGSFQSNEFWPFKLLFENLGLHRVSNYQSGSPLENVWAHSLTLSCTPGSVKGVGCIFNPHLSMPKVRVVTIQMFIMKCAPIFYIPPFHYVFEFLCQLFHKGFTNLKVFNSMFIIILIHHKLWVPSCGPWFNLNA